MKYLPYILGGLVFGVLVALASLVMKSPASPSYSFADAASKAAPSVVNIYTTKITQTSEPFDNNLLDYFYNQRQQRFQQKRELSLGSGVIINTKGFILTNLHVINNAEEILVLTHDGRESLATITGIDRETDLAVLRIPLDNLTPIDIGNLDQLRVGDPVLAIGNPYGFGQTVTSGIISAKGRYGLNLNTYENFLQTDAAINIGSSGGALINARGELIGINSAIYSQTGGSQGIGLAIPIDIATKVMTDIIRHGQVIRGWLGLEVTQLTAALSSQLRLNRSGGVIITNIHANGPAQNAGLMPGDIIIAIDGKSIRNGQEGLLEVANLEPGRKIQVEIIRSNLNKVIPVKVGVRPSL